MVSKAFLFGSIIYTSHANDISLSQCHILFIHHGAISIIGPFGEIDNAENISLHIWPICSDRCLLSSDISFLGIFIRFGDFFWIKNNFYISNLSFSFPLVTITCCLS